MVSNPPALWETWVGKILWRRTWQPTPAFLPGESPWTEESGGLQDHKELHTTEWLSTQGIQTISNSSRISILLKVIWTELLSAMSVNTGCCSHQVPTLQSCPKPEEPWGNSGWKKRMPTSTVTSTFRPEETQDGLLSTGHR